MNGDNDHDDDNDDCRMTIDCCSWGKQTSSHNVCFELRYVLVVPDGHLGDTVETNLAKGNRLTTVLEIDWLSALDKLLEE